MSTALKSTFSKFILGGATANMLALLNNSFLPIVMWINQISRVEQR